MHSSIYFFKIYDLVLWSLEYKCLTTTQSDLVNPISWSFGGFFQRIRPNLMWKWTKLHGEYDCECIKSSFQLIHYFPGKQGLAINLLWPALQSKQHTYRVCWHHKEYVYLDIISWSMWILILLAFEAITAFIGDQVGRWRQLNI